MDIVSFVNQQDALDASAGINRGLRAPEQPASETPDLGMPADVSLDREQGRLWDANNLWKPPVKNLDLSTAAWQNDDMTNTGFIEQAAWAIAGDPGVDPTGTWGKSFRNSVAQGLYGLVNSAPVFGETQKLADLRDELDELNRISAGIAAGKSNAEVFSDAEDPDLARERFDRLERQTRSRIEQELRDHAETAAWANRMKNLFPQSRLMTDINKAETITEAASLALSSPVEFLANIGPSSMVQFAPSLVALAVASTVAPAAVPSILMGMYSFGQDRSASLESNIAELGVDITNAEKLYDFYAHDTRFNEQREKADAHAMPVSILDALSFGIAGKMRLPRMVNPAIERVAPGASRLYKDFMGSAFRYSMTDLAVQGVTQGTLGGLGEALGQINAEGQVTNWGDVVAEFGGEFFTAPAEVMSASAGAIRTMAVEKLRAKEVQSRVREAIDAARENPDIQADPDAMHQTLHETVDKKNPAASAIYFSVKDLQDAGLLDRLSALSESVRSQVAEAEQTGGTISIPYSEFITKVAPDTLADELVPYVQGIESDTESEVDATIREILDRQAGRASEAAEEAVGTTEFREGLKQVRKEINAQIDAAGGVSAEEKATLVPLMMAQVEAIARDTGMTPQDLWLVHGARILGENDIEVAPDGTGYNLKTERAKEAFGRNAPNVDINQQENSLSEKTDEGIVGEFFRRAKVIARLKGANRSTLLHETGHFFLDTRVQIALELKRRGRLTPSQQRFVDLTEQVVQWLGASSIEEFAGLSTEKVRAMHEKFARTYEQYILDGHAPTAALRNVFRKFSNFLKQVYRWFANVPGSEMSPDVAAMFDGLFVSAEGVKEAQIRRNIFNKLDALHRAKTDEEKSAAAVELLRELDESFENATDEAEETLRARYMKDLGYLRRLHGRITRGLQRRVEQYRKMYEATERRALVDENLNPDTARLYKAWDAITKGTKVNGRDFKPKLWLSDLKRAGLTEKEIEALRERKMVMVRKDKEKYLPPEALASHFGFGSYAELAQKLATEKTFEEAVEDRVDQRMLEEFGELKTPADFARAADEAIFNPSLARAIAAEINYLEEAQGDRRATATAFRAVARALLSRKKVGELAPQVARRAAAKAGRQAREVLSDRPRQPKEGPRIDIAAALQGARKTAAEFLRQQLFQTCYASEEQEAMDWISKTRDRLRKRFNKKESGSVQGAYLEQLQYLLSRVGIIPEGKFNTPGESYEDFCARVQEEQGVVMPLMPESVRQAIADTDGNIDEMTVGEARDVLEFMNSVAAASRAATKLIIEGKEVDRAEAEQNILDAMTQEADAHKRKRKPEAESDDKKSHFKRILQAIGVSHARIPSLLAAMVGDRFGPFFTYVTKAFDAAADKEGEMKHKYAKAWAEVMAPLQKKARDKKKRFYKTLGVSMSPSELLAALLNLGNEGNTDRLIRGSILHPAGYDENGNPVGWDLGKLMQTIGEEFSKEELEAVQQVWDLISSLWPDVEALERRVGNRTPTTVKPRPIKFTLQSGETVELKGGYYPIKYDRYASEFGKDMDDERNALYLYQGHRNSTTTYQGQVKDRSAKTKPRALTLTLRAGFEGMEATIHDICWREPLATANKIFAKDGRVVTAIREYYGSEAVNGIRKWLERIATNGQTERGMGDCIADALRRNVSLAGLGFNLVTAAVQIVGITQSVVVLGGRWCLAGIGEFVAHPAEAKRFAEERSAMMRDRSRTRFRELTEIQAKLNGNQGNAADWIMRAAYKPIVWMQLMVDIPTWHGAYQKALAAGCTDEEAVARADRTVVEAQGSGRLHDLSGIETSGPWTKLFTVFYTFFNTALNIAAYSVSTKGAMRAATDLAILMCAQPIIEGFLREGLKDLGGGGGDDDDDWLTRGLKKAPLQPVNFALNTIVGLREIADIADVSGRGYGGPAGTRKLSDIYRFAQQVKQGEVDEALVKSAVTVFGEWSPLPIPVVPINRAISGTNALREGKTDSWLAPFLGYSKY